MCTIAACVGPGIQEFRNCGIHLSVDLACCSIKSWKSHCELMQNHGFLQFTFGHPRQSGIREFGNSGNQGFRNSFKRGPFDFDTFFIIFIPITEPYVDLNFVLRIRRNEPLDVVTLEAKSLVSPLRYEVMGVLKFVILDSIAISLSTLVGLHENTIYNISYVLLPKLAKYFNF